MGNPGKAIPVYIYKRVFLLPVKHDILATLSYFDIFDYPITQTEIFQFLHHDHSIDEVTEGLNQLSAENWIFKYDDFYTLQENHQLITRRRKGNVQARKMLKTADTVAAFLSGFPFVKGVAVSGSLSKNFAEESSDIDFFIITTRNRLWLARTMMHCFKKLTFLFNRQDWFCMNYYIDEDALEIAEKNIYTATEIATLLPLRGISIFEEFFQANKWSREFLPNHTLRISYVNEVNDNFFKKAVEFLLDNPLGNFFDYLLMKITARRWSKKTRTGRKNKRGMVMGMDAARHCAKPHPKNFQQKLVLTYEQKIVNLFRRFETRAKSIF